MAEPCVTGPGCSTPFALQPHFEVCRVRPADFKGFGLGMCCIEEVKQGSDLLSIPLSKCWTAESAKSSPELATLGDELLEAISDESLIALHILVVKSQGAAAEDACRRQHVAALEKAEFETLLDWSAEDLTMLAGSKWAMVVPKQLEDMREEFDELQDLLGDFFRTHDITWDSFFWAHSLLTSRSVSFYMEDGSTLLVLGPGQDMFNHSVDVPVGNDDVSICTSDTGHRLLTIRAYKDFNVGDQAFYSYSGASNGRLLMMAGFVIPENPFNAVELFFEFPVSTASRPLFCSLAEGLDAGVRAPGSVAAETKSAFLDTAEESAALHVQLTGQDVSAQLERVLAFFRLSHLCQGGAAPTPEELAASDGSEACQRRALLQLREHLLQMLKLYPTTLEEDEASLLAAEAQAGKAKAKERRGESCLRVLVGEKRIYGQALAWLEGRLQES
mmetsp:Transcript_1646/g.5078  ORF Transcript_1646/g.5078 Transcript_1646/m.5078 type:complete len:445 (-) Transcript_1646:2-1336(-)